MRECKRKRERKREGEREREMNSHASWLCLFSRFRETSTGIVGCESKDTVSPLAGITTWIPAMKASF